MKQSVSIFFLWLSLSFQSFAQTDPFIGTWSMEEKKDSTSAPFFVELQIASPGSQILYPAQLKVRYENFNATYQLLLVKKSNGELAISRTKHPVNEMPFSIGTRTVLLNGSFVFENKESGISVLNVHRIPSKRYGIAFPAILGYEEADRLNVIQISDFLSKGAIALKKVSAQPWRSADANKLLFTYEAPAYFGLIDTLYTKEGEARLTFSENNKADNDTISVMLNGKMIIDKMDISKPINPMLINLDTGLNILCLFADNYGRVSPNTAKLNITLPSKKFILDFTTAENLSATFIIAKIYYYPNKEQQIPAEIIARKSISDKINNRSTKLIDSIKAEAQEITLAIWDDAVEDGDSISLKINDEIYLPGIAVKKKPQFIQVKLYPGENKIIFIADNLGSIPPNTSVLEIIDGKRRKSYMIDTNLGQNNAIKILYDYKPSQ